MNVDTHGVAMFLHIALVVLGMMLGGFLQLSLIQSRRAETVAELRPWVPVIRRVEPLLPIVALAVLATGAWLLHLSDGEFTWGQSWIVTSVIALVVAEGVGASLNPASHSLTAAITEAPEGPVGPELHQRTVDPVLWFGSHFVTAVFFGVIFVMSAQPEGTWQPAVVVVIAAVIGLLSALPFVRHGTVVAGHGRPAG
jgi:Predicted integral membrane protein (DUF2269)